MENSLNSALEKSKELEKLNNNIRNNLEQLKKSNNSNNYWKTLALKEILDIDFKELDLIDQGNYLKPHNIQYFK